MSRNVSSYFESCKQSHVEKMVSRFENYCRLCTEKAKRRFFIFLDSGKADNLSFLCTIIAKVKVSEPENDGLPGVQCKNCYNQIVNLRN